MVTHRDLDAFKVSREIVVIVLRLSRERWRPWAAALFSQALRASLSVQLNIAEGYAFGRTRTRLHHYRVAYGSAVETGELCDHLAEAGIVDKAAAETLVALSLRSRGLCWGLVRSELRERETGGGNP